MSKLTSQQYAGLAEDAYSDEYPVGAFEPAERDPVTIEGVAHYIRAHVDNPKTGYQGTIYQRVDTGDLVVAHRGTEGKRELVAPLARAAVGAGADGIMVDVHPAPDTAKVDGAQALLPSEFADLMESVRALAGVLGLKT